MSLSIIQTSDCNDKDCTKLGPIKTFTLEIDVRPTQKCTKTEKKVFGQWYSNFIDIDQISAEKKNILGLEELLRRSNDQLGEYY